MRIQTRERVIAEIDTSDLVGNLFYMAAWMLVCFGLPLYVLLPWLQLCAGEARESGFFLRQDPQKAAEWYEAAIKPRALFFTGGVPGVTEAHYRLGGLYSDGRGVAKDTERARTLLTVAAERGHADAQNDLYVLLKSEPQPDWPTALSWLRYAVKGKSAWALCNIGALHQFGAPGVLEDPIEARAFYERAYQRDAGACVYRLGLALADGIGGPADETRAYTLLLTVAESGTASETEQSKLAQLRVGQMLLSGRGVTADAERGKAWLRRAGWLGESAEAGDSQANVEIAQGLLDGADPAKAQHNPQNVRTRLQKAADSGHVMSMWMLSQFYDRGVGGPVNTTLAETWATRASQGGDGDATVWLIDQAIKSKAQAAVLAEMAKRLEYQGTDGQTRAQQKLATMYLEGTGVAQDKSRAYGWLSLAASMSPYNGNAEEKRRELSKMLKPDELAVGQKIARELASAITAKEKAAASATKN